jgi:hypothetical protein
LDPLLGYGLQRFFDLGMLLKEIPSRIFGKSQQLGGG